MGSMRQAAVFLVLLGACAACASSMRDRDVTAIITGPAQVGVGKTVTLAATLEYSGGKRSLTQPSDATIIWASTKEAVATISSAGVVTGIAPGDAVISAT